MSMLKLVHNKNQEQNCIFFVDCISGISQGQMSEFAVALAAKQLHGSGDKGEPQYLKITEVEPIDHEFWSQTLNH